MRPVKALKVRTGKKLNQGTSHTVCLSLGGVKNVKSWMLSCCDFAFVP